MSFVAFLVEDNEGIHKKKYCSQSICSMMEVMTPTGKFYGKVIVLDSLFRFEKAIVKLKLSQEFKVFLLDLESGKTS